VILISLPVKIYGSKDVAIFFNDKFVVGSIYK
jgi:hypothetical protein